MTNPTKIGLYGGSFDPVHLGHLLVAQAALEEVRLHRIFFIPAALSPFKQGLPPAPGLERLRLLRLALAGNPALEVDPQEIERGGTSYSIETVRDFRRRFPGAELHLLVGADHAPLLPDWHAPAELAASVRIIVIPRPGRESIPPPPPFQGVLLKGFPLDLSSSQIRERVRRGLPIDHLAPAAVVEAIRNNRLYL